LSSESVLRYIVDSPPEVTAQIAAGRLDEINVLLRASRIPGLDSDPESAINTLLDMARDIRYFDGALLYVVHPGQQKILSVFSKGFEDLPLPEDALSAGNHFLQWTLDHEASFLVPSRDGTEATADTLKQYGSRSFLSVPCFSGHTLVGALQLFSRQAGFFHPDDVRLYLILSQQGEKAVSALLCSHDDVDETAVRSWRKVEHDYLCRELRREHGRARRSGSPVSMLLTSLMPPVETDLAFSHLELENLMRQFSQQLTDRLRPGDLVARYDTGEMVVLLPETSGTHASRVARRLRRTIRYELGVGDPPIRPLLTSVSMPLPSNGSQPDLSVVEHLRSPLLEQQRRLWSSHSAIMPPRSPEPVSALHNEQRHLFRPDLEKMELASNASFDVNRLLDLLLLVGMESLGAERGSLVLQTRQGPRRNLLKLQSARGLQMKEDPGEVVLNPSEGLLGHILEEKLPLFTADVRRDFPRLTGRPDRNYTNRSCLCVPVVNRGQVLGVFSYSNRKHGMDPFDKIDLERVKPLIDSAAAIISEGQRFDSLQQDFISLASLSLVRMAEVQLPWRDGHAQRVSTYSLEIGRHLGFPEKDLTALEQSAMLHDIGMIGIHPQVLAQEHRFNRHDLEIIKSHTALGWKLLKALPFGRTERDVVLHHHEKVDGSGYPDGLKGTHIPITARIVAAADIFDALTSQRPHRPAMTPAEALQEISAMAGTHLDPRITAVMPEIIRHHV
jgi:GGDEF domain-containing protein/GAF domain-containing protein